MMFFMTEHCTSRMFLTLENDQTQENSSTETVFNDYEVSEFQERTQQLTNVTKELMSHIIRVVEKSSV